MTSTSSSRLSLESRSRREVRPAPAYTQDELNTFAISLAKQIVTDITRGRYNLYAVQLKESKDG